MNRLRTIGAFGALLIVLAACGPAASTSSQPDPSSEAPAASEPQSSNGGPEPSFSAGLVADLEVLIPDTVGGMEMTIQSMQGNDYLLQGDDPATVKFLEDLGVSPSDVAMAFGFAFSAEESAGVFVFRAEGAGSDRLRSVFKESLDAERDEPLVWTTTNVAGKQFEVSTDADTSTYMYVSGDILVWFFASSDEIAEEIASGLP